MHAHLISDAIKKIFPYHPTGDQTTLTDKLAEFVTDPSPDTIFVLKGYAGTGKTSIVSSLVNVLAELKVETVLLAPTGRAAKVLSAYAGQRAFTIHKKIYRLLTGADGSVKISLQKNRHKHCFFIVDEASMIPYGQAETQGSLFGGVSLLDDLIHFVYTSDHCRLLFIGDTAQLPPVHSTESPALNKQFLENRYRLRVHEFELKDVVRHAKDSGILFNATLLREMLGKQQQGFPAFRLQGFDDLMRIQGSDAADAVHDAFISHGREEALMICYSNKRAYLYNRHIRERVLFMEEEINAGELLMVVRNNYFWLPEESEAGFIANGDIIELNRIIRTETVYGFSFADVNARMLDYPGEPELEVKLLLDTLSSDGPALSRQDAASLFDAVAADYQHIPNKRTRLAHIRNNPYLNALQVKYAYAMTCHKTQGGQWRHVFVEMGYLPSKKPDIEYLRWLYTAITRGTEKVFLMNFTGDFFENNNLENDNLK